MTEEPSTCKKSRGKQQTHVALCLCNCFSYSFVSQHIVLAGWTCWLTDSVVRASPIQNPFGADGFFGGAQQKKKADGKGGRGGGIFGATWQ